VRIDFHVHAYPFPSLPEPARLPFIFGRAWVRHTLEPLARGYQDFHAKLRHLPAPLRVALEAGTLTGAGALGLVAHSSIDDLMAAMDEAQIDHALLVAHPPFIPNAWALDSARDSNDRLSVAVRTQDPTALRSFIDGGAKALKIHSTADLKRPGDPSYLPVLEVCAELDVPVIIHTGTGANPKGFEPWFEAFPRLPFVLAHLNFHDPESAYGVGERHANVRVDTSWQPAETVSEAVRLLGADRVLMASDWPFVGANLKVARERVEEARRGELLSAEAADRVMGGNARELLKL